MALPASWVDSLFARLQVRYGASWLSMWNGIDISAVKADWAQRLAGFERHADAITYALENLPSEWPPNAAQFAAICNRAPVKTEPAIAWTDKASPEVVAKVLTAFRESPPHGSLDWANRLRAREVALERLTPYQRGAWRMAIERAPTPELAPGGFTPPPRDVLPPGMLSGRNEPINHEGTP